MNILIRRIIFRIFFKTFNFILGDISKVIYVILLINYLIDLKDLISIFKVLSIDLRISKWINFIKGEIINLFVSWFFLWYLLKLIWNESISIDIVDSFLTEYERNIILIIWFLLFRINHLIFITLRIIFLLEINLRHFILNEKSKINSFIWKIFFTIMNFREFIKIDAISDCLSISFFFFKTFLLLWETFLLWINYLFCFH